jgi:hypothetical protein
MMSLVEQLRILLILYRLCISLRLRKLSGGPTEELLAPTALLNDLNQSRLQLLNRRNVICENAHLSGFCWDIDLDNILRFVD